MFGGLPIGTLEAAGEGPSVLALHGFGATPQEVELVVSIARDLGLRALAPLLPGHGLSVEVLAQTRFEDWRAAAERALFEVAPDRAPAIVVGSSMGSLLALDLAASFPRKVVGVAALAPAIRLAWPFPSLALSVLSGLRIPDFTIPKSAPDILDAIGRGSQITYARQPAHAGNEVRVAGRRVRARLGEIRCPAFIAHGRRDHVCPVANARRVHAEIGTPEAEKELLILPRSYHIVTRDVDRGLLRTRLYAFVKRVALAARAGAETEPQPPVDPYPPAARSLADNASTTSSSARTTAATTS
jgi:carboxylesterase